MALQSIVLPLVSVFRSVGFNEALKALKGLDGGFAAVAKSAGTAAASFAAASVLQSVTQYIDEAVVATQKYERNMLALNQVFGTQIGTMRQFTKDAAAMGISQGQAAQAGVFLGSVLKQYGLSAEQTTAETQKLINLSQDLATTYGYDLQEALLAMTALFRGEYDPIEKFGVAMKQNEINALLAARGQDKLTGTMLFQAQVQARLDLLYQRSADSVGAYERAQGTLYVSQQNLNAALENQQIAFGSGLQEPLAAVTNIFADIVRQLTPAAAVIGQVLGSIIDFTVKVGGGFLNGVATSISNIIGLIPAAITGLYELTMAINAALGGRGPQDSGPVSDERSRQIAKLTADVAYAQQILTAKQKEGALGLSQYEANLRKAQNALIVFQYGTTSASQEEQLFRNRIDATARSLENAVPPVDEFIKKLKDLGIYSADADDKLTGLAAIFSDIDEAAKKSEASDELEKIGFNADQIAEILSKPDWATIFGTISKYAKIAAIDVASIGGSAQYAAAVAQGKAQAVIDELLKGLSSSSTTGSAITDYVSEFYGKLDEEIAKQSARDKLSKMGASEALIDSILGGQGWQKVLDAVLEGGVAGLKKLQDQFNKTGSGLEEIKKLQDEAAAAAKKAQDAAVAAAEKIAEQQRQYDELVKSLKQFRDSIKEIAGVDVLGTIEVQVGRFESAVVASLNNIKSSLKSALDAGQIYENAYKQLIDYANKELGALQAIQRQRDELANKYDFVQNLLKSYRDAFTASLGLTSILSKMQKQTQEITITETQAGVAKVGSSIKELQFTLTRSYTEVIEQTSSKSEELINNFRTMAEKAKTFAENLKALKQMGLDPMLFNQLVQAGVEAGGETAQALVDGGQDTVSEISSIFKEIGDTGIAVGEVVAEDFYSIGENFASSLLDGIRSQQTAFEETARSLAESFQTNFDVKVGTATKQVSDVAQFTNDLTNLQAELEDQLAKQAAKQAALDALPENRYSGTKAAYNKSLGIYAETIAGLKDKISALESSIANTKVGTLATGGIALGAALSVIGENGPEAVIPLDKLDSMLNKPSSTGGNVYNIYVNADTRIGGSKAGEAIVQQLKQYETKNGPIGTVLTVN